MESFSLYIHIFSRNYAEKKLLSSKNPENGLFQKSPSIKKDKYFFVLFLYLLQENSYSWFGFKISNVYVKNCNGGHKIINLATKVFIFKMLITSKLIDLAK